LAESQPHDPGSHTDILLDAVKEGAGAVEFSRDAGMDLSRVSVKRDECREDVRWRRGQRHLGNARIDATKAPENVSPGKYPAHAGAGLTRRDLPLAAIHQAIPRYSGGAAPAPSVIVTR